MLRDLPVSPRDAVSPLVSDEADALVSVEPSILSSVKAAICAPGSFVKKRRHQPTENPVSGNRTL